jgi:hypothetical protein
MLNVILLSVINLSDVILNAVMLNAIIQSAFGVKYAVYLLYWWSGFSSKRLFIKMAFHRNGFSSNAHRGGFSLNLHEGVEHLMNEPLQCTALLATNTPELNFRP